MRGEGEGRDRVERAVRRRLHVRDARCRRVRALGALLRQEAPPPLGLELSGGHLRSRGDRGEVVVRSWRDDELELCSGHRVRGGEDRDAVEGGGEGEGGERSVGGDAVEREVAHLRDRREVTEGDGRAQKVAEGGGGGDGWRWLEGVGGC